MATKLESEAYILLKQFNYHFLSLLAAEKFQAKGQFWFLCEALVMNF